MVISSYWKIEGLTMADRLAYYSSLSYFIIYLTDHGPLAIDYLKAALIVNVIDGLMRIISIPLQHIADAFLGNYRMVLCSSFAYGFGLGFLSMSATGSGKRQKFFFYSALPLLVVGRSTHQELPSLEELIKDEDKKSSKWRKFFKVASIIAVFLVGVIAISFIGIWSVNFGIPAICMVVASFLLMHGLPSQYQEDKAKGSPLTTVFRVFVASFFRRNSPDQMDIERSTDDRKSLTRWRLMRCLDKATINLENSSEEENRWKRHCEVEEVKQTKRAIYAIPVCTALFMLGVVSSIGDTYFLKQADNMNPYIGELEVPVVILQIWFEISKAALRKLYSKIAKRQYFGKSRYAGCVGFAVSMFIALLCCFTAASVECRRLRSIVYDQKTDKTTVEMSMFWLVPQFFLLGGLDGISEKSIELFFDDEAPTSSDRFMRHVASALYGLGIIGSILSVYVAREVTAWGDNTSWFEDDLNRSRLDKYYWVLAATTIADFIYYIILYYFVGLRSEFVNDSDQRVSD